MRESGICSLIKWSTSVISKWNFLSKEAYTLLSGFLGLILKRDEECRGSIDLATFHSTRSEAKFKILSKLR